MPTYIHALEYYSLEFRVAGCGQVYTLWHCGALGDYSIGGRCVLRAFHMHPRMARGF